MTITNEERRQSRGTSLATADVAQLLRNAATNQPAHGVKFCTSEVDDMLLTYPQLLDQADRLLYSLRQQGATPGRVVALLLEEPAEFIPAFWACMLGGLIACPVLPLRADHDRWAQQLADMNVLLDTPLVLTSSQINRDLPPVEGLDVLCLQDIDILPRESQVHHIPPHRCEPDDPAVLVLTSGSTGGRKAVKLTHRNLIASMAGKTEAHRATSQDVTLNWISYDHVAALLEAHLLPMSTGATQLHIRTDKILADPLLLLRLLHTHRVTMTFSPNFLLGLINDLLREGASANLDLSCVQRIITGGEANPVATGLEFVTRLEPYGLDRSALWPAYGMTETCAGCIYNHDFPDADRDAEFASVGRPFSTLHIRIATEEDSRPVPDGQVGELQLRGPMITEGYWNNPDATNASLTADGWFRTGDLGIISDGRLTLVGRSKDSVIINGVIYYSHEVESVLNELGGVETSFVAAFPTRAQGTDTEQLVIALAATQEVATDESAFYRLLMEVKNRVVLHWGFRPSVILPLSTADFPKTSLGKIERRVLRTRLESGAYDSVIAATEALLTSRQGPYTPPEGETEEVIAGLFAEIFDVDPARIGATASFFDLGGTSLDILRLKRLLAQRLPDADPPVLAILTAPTVRDLAARLDRRHAGQQTYDPVVPLQTRGSKTPLFCIHPGVGEVLVFVNLAKYFIDERPFYAIRARGFNPGDRPFESFPEMVQCYVQAIRDRQPHGPYAIAGYSFGGVVAFEVAKVLESQGEHVGFLGSFNLPPHIKYRMDELEHIDTTAHLAMFLELLTTEQAEQLPDQVRALDKAEQMSRLIAMADKDRLDELGLDVERFTQWADLANALTLLGRTYEPTGKTRRISVFCAQPLQGTREDWVNKQLKRWDEHTDEPNRYIQIPGEHYTLMGPKHVSKFQEILRAELDRVLDGN
ncbi:AMP-binding protein [Kibdelosporangium aridum]|uniref:AMP-binding protein n=1 Tax=Kibdelosporangium aridum TaxID=2030 RepID=UPI000AEE99AB